MTEQTKNYIRGSAKEVTTQYGKLINVSLSKEDLDLATLGNYLFL